MSEGWSERGRDLGWGIGITTALKIREKDNISLFHQVNEVNLIKGGHAEGKSM